MEFDFFKFFLEEYKIKFLKKLELIYFIECQFFLFVYVLCDFDVKFENVFINIFI